MIRHNGIRIDRKNRVISHRGAIVLPRKQFSVACHLILAGPITRLELFDMLYRDDPEGGPLNDLNTASVWMTYLRPRLGLIGLEIVADGTGYPKKHSIVC